MSDGKIGICVVGSGRAGMIHAVNFRKNVPGADIVAVVDTVEETAKNAAAELGIDTWYTSHTQALEDKRIDAFVVVSPTKYHVGIVKDIAAEKKHIFYHSKNTYQAGELDFTYFNAVYTVENALAKVKDEKGMKRVEKFLKQEVCPVCGGSRLSEAARAPRLQGISLAEACQMTLTELADWVENVPASLPEEMVPMAESICESFRVAARRLLDLGLGYLTLDRASSTLSTGERQRMQLARAVRNRTTGVLYVLDEPSIGLHPANIEGLAGVMDDLVSDGNSVVLVDHDTQILAKSDWIIEMGPGAGQDGGRVIASGTPGELGDNPFSQIGPFLSGKADVQ